MREKVGKGGKGLKASSPGDIRNLLGKDNRKPLEECEEDLLVRESGGVRWEFDL